MRNGELFTLTAHLCIGITEFDGNIPFQLILESDWLNTGDSFDRWWFTMSDMTDGTCITRLMSSNCPRLNSSRPLRDKGYMDVKTKLTYVDLVSSNNNNLSAYWYVKCMMMDDEREGGRKDLLWLVLRWFPDSTGSTSRDPLQLLDSVRMNHWYWCKKLREQEDHWAVYGWTWLSEGL